MNCALLTNTLVTWIIKVKNFKWIIVPVQDTSDTDYPINVDFIVANIELLERFLFVFFTRE